MDVSSAPADPSLAEDRRTLERADVVIVGARCAGTAAASVFARAGKRVVVLDRARFPSDTMSTHTIFGVGMLELERMGALDRVLGLNPPRLRSIDLVVDGGTDQEIRVHSPFRPYRGHEGVISVPRRQLDGLLVETIRDQGADVREGSSVESVNWAGGRAAGVTYRDSDGTLRTIESDLVVGADGRHSRVAHDVGSWTPYRESGHGRSAVYAYVSDPRAGDPAAREFHHWRDGAESAIGAPTTNGQFVLLFMGSADDEARARRDPLEYWKARLDTHPGVVARLGRCEPIGSIRIAGELTSYFRASAGPGWALVGDAGHFKDPILGQGMRDAWWAGRTMAEASVDVLANPDLLDIALRRWEATRDAECLPMYFWGSAEARHEPTSYSFANLLRAMAADTNSAILSDIANREVTPQRLMTRPKTLAYGLSAFRRASNRPEFVRTAVADARLQIRVWRETRRRRFRSTMTVDGAEWPVTQFPEASVVDR